MHNMATLSREATTFRRVMDSLFRHFDNTNSWSSKNGLALCVLLDMQMFMENSGALFAYFKAPESRPLAIVINTATSFIYL